VVVADSNSLTWSTGLTISQWVKATHTTVNNGYILNKNPVGSGFLGVNLFTGTTAGAWYIPRGGAYSTLAFTHNIVAGQWTHFVFTYDSGAGAKIYMNNALIASDATFTGSLDTATGPLYISNYQGGAGGYPFDGSIDDVRIYNRALSAHEVSNLYNSSGEALGILNRAHRDTLTSGLVGYWSFDGPTMTTANSSDSSSPGTLTGGQLNHRSPWPGIKV
jgi:hypothetical protein